MLRQLCFCLLLAGLGFISLNAQVLEPVKWTFSLEQVSETEYNIHADAAIDKNWVVYSQDLGPNGPVPTSMLVKEEQGVAVVGTPSEHGEMIEKQDPIFRMVLKKYEDSLRLTQKITVDANTKRVTGYVEFMCCDTEKCLPPEYVDFELSIK